MRSIVGGHVLHIDVHATDTACAVGYIVTASQLLDNLAVLDESGTQVVVAGLVERYGATTGDGWAADSRLGAVGSIDDSSTTVRRGNHSRYSALITASKLVD